jgi:hypothetical protein
MLPSMPDRGLFQRIHDVQQHQAEVIRAVTPRVRLDPLDKSTGGGGLGGLSPPPSPTLTSGFGATPPSPRSRQGGADGGLGGGGGIGSSISSRGGGSRMSLRSPRSPRIARTVRELPTSDGTDASEAVTAAGGAAWMQAVQYGGRPGGWLGPSAPMAAGESRGVTPAPHAKRTVHVEPVGHPSPPRTPSPKPSRHASRGVAKPVTPGEKSEPASQLGSPRSPPPLPEGTTASRVSPSPASASAVPLTITGQPGHVLQAELS